MLWLVYNGVPWHVATELPPDEHFIFTAAERIAVGIIFGQFAGGRFDFDAMSWREDK